MNRGKVDEEIVGIAAIDAEIVGAPAATIHRYCAGAVTSINERVAGAGSGHDAGLQLQKLVGIARVERQIRDFPRVHDCAELGARGIDQRRFRRDIDYFLLLADLHHHIERDDLVEIDGHAMAKILLKPR